ncbi:MAG: DUF2207 domain-containing protein [Dysosmobacter sp.]
MKQKIAVIIVAFLCAALLCTPSLAASRVSEMELDVALRPDGSAHITQVWTTDTDEGTEFYLGCRDSGYLTITDFSVSDQNGSYVYVEGWDVDASFEEKANRCGILETGEGVELCWGISEYGENRYTIEYVLHDLVGSYSDADGFNHRFVDEMNFFPTDVALTIRNQDGTPLTDEICDIWAFGFDGQIRFEDGVIRAWSEEPLERDQHMTVMVSLEKGVLSPRRAVEDSFETVKERALVGSDYGDGEDAEWDDEPLTAGDVLLFAAIILTPVLLILLLVVLLVKVGKARRKKRMEQAGYFRDAPNDGNLNVTYQLGLCSGLCKEDALLGAYLMRLISQGCLESTDNSIDAESVRLRLDHAPQSGNAYEDALYTILEAAAGADGVLDPNELERYCGQNYIPLSHFMESCERSGKQTLIRSGCLKGAVLGNDKDLTKKGQQELDEVYGLKHFLLDFSLIHERGVKEAVIWQDYMVYALMLGIADKLEAQIQELYPDQFPQLNQYRRYVRYTGCYNGVMYGAYSREKLRRTPSHRSGGGGRVSFGGGGGFSGGGSGGIR